MASVRLVKSITLYWKVPRTTPAPSWPSANQDHKCSAPSAESCYSIGFEVKTPNRTCSLRVREPHVPAATQDLQSCGRDHSTPASKFMKLPHPAPGHQPPRVSPVSPTANGSFSAGVTAFVGLVPGSNSKSGVNLTSRPLS